MRFQELLMLEELTTNEEEALNIVQRTLKKEKHTSGKGYKIYQMLMSLK